MQSNHFLLVAIGNLNAKSAKWYVQIDITSFESNRNENITSQFGLSQIINEQTHVLDTSSSFLIYFLLLDET